MPTRYVTVSRDNVLMEENIDYYRASTVPRHQSFWNRILDVCVTVKIHPISVMSAFANKVLRAK
jgi:hypothetical protein